LGDLSNATEEVYLSRSLQRSEIDMPNIKQCNFNSVWDDGALTAMMNAEIDLDTGRISEIQRIKVEYDDGREPDALAIFYISFDELHGEFEVERRDDEELYVCNLDAVVAVIEPTPSVSPSCP
jgi:hypothetical protein